MINHLSSIVDMTTSKTKCCSPSPLGPEQKHPKHEHPPTDASPENPFSPYHNYAVLSLIHMIASTWVFTSVTSGNEEFKTKTLVSLDQFQANVGPQKSQFLESFHKMVAADWTQDKLKAFLNHGMSRCYETNHLTSDP